MTSEQVLIAHAVKLATLLALVGVFARGRYRACWSFPAYLAAILICNVLVSFWPDTFYTGWFWILKQALYDILKLAIALELAFRIFRSFPGTHRRAFSVGVTILGVTTLGLITFPVSAEFDSIVHSFQPRPLAGTIWLLTGTALLVAWYRLPLETFHRVLLLGFSGYLLIFTTLLNVLRDFGFDGLRARVSLVDTVAYLALMCFWAYAAWRPDEEPELSVAAIRALAERA